jgi:CheY-like chemotaxis protein
MSSEPAAAESELALEGPDAGGALQPTPQRRFAVVGMQEVGPAEALGRPGNRAGEFVELRAGEVAGMMLRLAGAQVRSVGSGDEALSLPAADPPDVLVSDIGMPGMDGYELVRRVRRMPAAEVRTLPAIALTGFTAAEDRDRALEAGFQDHLPKPVELAALAASIRRAIDKTARPVNAGPE